MSLPDVGRDRVFNHYSITVEFNPEKETRTSKIAQWQNSMDKTKKGKTRGGGGGRENHVYESHASCREHFLEGNAEYWWSRS